MSVILKRFRKVNWKSNHGRGRRKMVWAPVFEATFTVSFASCQGDYSCITIDGVNITGAKKMGDDLCCSLFGYKNFLPARITKGGSVIGEFTFGKGSGIFVTTRLKAKEKFIDVEPVRISPNDLVHYMREGSEEGIIFDTLREALND